VGGSRDLGVRSVSPIPNPRFAFICTFPRSLPATTPNRPNDLYNTDYHKLMPTGTSYDSFVAPYPIRVDDFTSANNLKTKPALHLHTHTHWDDVRGLSAKSFVSAVVCSPDAKEMLLKHEVYAERALHVQQIRAQGTRTYAHFKVDPTKRLDGRMLYVGSCDLLVSKGRFTLAVISLS
jgi:hypothetical protein